MDQDYELLFEEAGWDHVYQKHSFKIWLSGCFEDVEDEVLEAFFDMYSAEETGELCFDDFIFQFRMFAFAYRMNKDKVDF